MGLEFIRAQSANYLQKRDSSRAMLDVCDLLERANPDRVRELFSVQLRDPAVQLEAGYRVLVKFDSETTATVSQNGLVVGDLDSTDAAEISKRLKAKGKVSGMFEVLIHETQDFSGCFKVAAVEPKDIRIEDDSSEK